MSIKAKIVLGLLVGASLIGQDKPKVVPPPVEAPRYRVCVRSESGEGCSARLWTKEQAEAIEQMFLQAPIPCPYDVGIIDATTQAPTPAKHEQDHSGETKI